MTECTRCGMRDDDWFLCKEINCSKKERKPAGANAALEGLIADLELQSYPEARDAATTLRALMAERDEAHKPIPHDALTYPAPLHGWTCFHCGEHFEGNLVGSRRARLHFGWKPDAEPVCQIQTKGNDRVLNMLRFAEHERHTLRAQLDEAKEELRSERDRIEAAKGLETIVERLTKLLEGRDKFMVDQGLWEQLVKGLKP